MVTTTTYIVSASTPDLLESILCDTFIPRSPDLDSPFTYFIHMPTSLSCLCKEASKPLTIYPALGVASHSYGNNLFHRYLAY